MLSKYIKNTKELISQNKSMIIVTIFVTSLTGFLMFIALYIAIIGHKFSEYLNNSQKISVLFDATTPATEINSFINKYKSNPAVVRIYQKKPEEVMQQMLPDNMDISKDDLIKIVRIDLNSNVDNNNLVNSILEEQNSNEDILEVIYLPSLYNKLKKVSTWGNLTSISIAVISGIVSLGLIYTTLRLGLEKFNKELQIMKDIGAPYSFIERPLFLTTSFIIIIGEILNLLFLTIVAFLFLYLIKQLDLRLFMQSIIDNLKLQSYFSLNFVLLILILQLIIYIIFSFYFTKKLTLKAYEKIK